MNQQENLRSVIMGQFRSIRDFAKAVGWSYSKAYRIANGRQAPDSDDIRAFCNTVGLDDPGRIIRLFSLA